MIVDPAVLSIKWQRRDPADCAVAGFDGDYVIYHRLSGITHLLNEASHQLLTDRLDEPASFRQILEWFDIAFDEQESKDKVDCLGTMLLRLEEFGLLRRIVDETK